MRSFQLLFWIILFLFYAIITFLSMKNNERIFPIGRIRKFRLFYLLFATAILISMILLYVWPGDIRTSDKYRLYFYFNGLLLIDFIYKIAQSLFFLLSIFAKRGIKRVVVGWMGSIFSVSMIFVLLYGILIGRDDVVVNRIDLEYENLPQAFDGYQLIHISDIHLGSFTSNKVLTKSGKIINQIDPDLILFTGDLVNNFSYELDGWNALFHSINEGREAYSILGNHDYGNYSRWASDAEKNKNFNAILNAHGHFGFKLLRNENTVIYSGKDSVYLIGVENWGHPPFPQYANLEKALQDVPESSFMILLTHDPAHWESQVKDKRKIELTLSGHTHGLQMCFRPAGIPLSPSWFVRKYWGGLYYSGNTRLYVNLGLGTIGMPFRIDNPSEITLITLKRIKID